MKISPNNFIDILVTIISYFSQKMILKIKMIYHIIFFFISEQCTVTIKNLNFFLLMGYL